MHWRCKIFLQEIDLNIDDHVNYFKRLIIMHWQCNIFLDMHSIKLFCGAIFISLFLEYLNKFLHVVIN
jgi:hypothetical protein